MARAGAHAHRRATHIHSRGKNGTSCRCSGGATSSKTSRMRCCGKRRASNSSPVPALPLHARSHVSAMTGSTLAASRRRPRRECGTAAKNAYRQPRDLLASSPPCLHALMPARTSCTRMALFHSDTAVLLCPVLRFCILPRCLCILPQPTRAWGFCRTWRVVFVAEGCVGVLPVEARPAATSLLQGVCPSKQGVCPSKQGVCPRPSLLVRSRSLAQGRDRERERSCEVGRVEALVM
jgi:hypothetical protein